MTQESPTNSLEVETAKAGCKVFIEVFRNASFDDQVLLAYSSAGADIQAIQLGLKPAAYLGNEGNHIAQNTTFPNLETAPSLCVDSKGAEKPTIRQNAIFYSKTQVAKVIFDNPDYFPTGTTIEDAIHGLDVFSRENTDVVVRTGLLLGIPKQDAIDYATYGHYRSLYAGRVLPLDAPIEAKRYLENSVDNRDDGGIPGLKYISSNPEEYNKLRQKYFELYSASGLKGFIDKLRLWGSPYNPEYCGLAVSNSLIQCG